MNEHAGYCPSCGRMAENKAGFFGRWLPVRQYGELTGEHVRVFYHRADLDCSPNTVSPGNALVVWSETRGEDLEQATLAEVRLSDLV